MEPGRGDDFQLSAAQIEGLVSQLTRVTSLEAEELWERLRPLGVRVVPFLVAAYPDTSRAPGRLRLVYSCIRYGRVSDEAFQLGLLAVNDRGTLVRYRACMLLAYSLRRDALPVLRTALGHSDERTRADALAAIDAIEHQNHHLFVDRTHSGRIRLIVDREVDDVDVARPRDHRRRWFARLRGR